LSIGGQRSMGRNPDPPPLFHFDWNGSHGVKIARSARLPSRNSCPELISCKDAKIAKAVIQSGVAVNHKAFQGKTTSLQKLTKITKGGLALFPSLPSVEGPAAALASVNRFICPQGEFLQKLTKITKGVWLCFLRCLLLKVRPRRWLL
jgi:hypothetical protein